MDATPGPPTARPLTPTPRASTVIVHTVQPTDVDRYLTRQRDIEAAARKFPGYQRVDIYPPDTPQGTEWVVVLHFDTPASLEAWMTSSVRAAWIQKLEAEGLGFRETRLPHGFGAWLAGASGDLPPAWKIMLTVLLGLYPTVMLLNTFVSPWTIPHMGFAAAMLVGNALSVCLLQWVVMRILNKALGPWLKTRDLLKSIGGAGAIVVALAVLAMLFRLKTG